MFLSGNDVTAKQIQNGGSMHSCSSCATLPRNSRALSVWSAASIVLPPKCPLCIVGWMGAVGLGGYASHAAMIPTAMLVLFCASQAVFFVNARKTGDLRAPIASALGVVVLLASASLGLGTSVRLLGVGLLVTASILDALATVRARHAAVA